MFSYLVSETKWEDGWIEKQCPICYKGTVTAADGLEYKDIFHHRL